MKKPFEEWECEVCKKKHSQEFSRCCPDCDLDRESGDLEVD